MEQTVSQHVVSARFDQQPSNSLRNLEMAVQRAHEGLIRWQAECFERLSGVSLSGAEITLLLLIGEGSGSKSIKEMAGITNRVDIPNIQYSLRKLASAGLTRKQGAGRSGVSYSLTEEGSRMAVEMQAAREGLMQQAFPDLSGMNGELENALKVLEGLAGLYGAATGTGRNGDQG